MPDIPLKCGGDSGEFKVPKKPDTLTFKTAGNCTLISFGFVPTDPPPGFTRLPANPGGSIPYKYDGRAIPPGGYSFGYTTSALAPQGNGTGVIKNN
jgi:hypothetical protein